MLLNAIIEVATCGLIESRRELKRPIDIPLFGATKDFFDKTNDKSDIAAPKPSFF
jgi:hypothetical protein